jgi:hypothetical protein
MMVARVAVMEDDQRAGIPRVGKIVEYVIECRSVDGCTGHLSLLDVSPNVALQLYRLRELVTPARRDHALRLAYADLTEEGENLR